MPSFIRLVESSRKAEDLLAELCAETTNAFRVDVDSFRVIPNSPMCYWINQSVRDIYRELSSVEETGAALRQGLATADDFRFARLAVEVPQAAVGARWQLLVKGGRRSPFYRDVDMVVNWFEDGREVREFVDPATGKVRSRVQNVDSYFLPCLTWLRRSSKLTLTVVPEGAIFSDASQAVIAPRPYLPSYLGLLSSSVADFLVKLTVGRTGSSCQFMPGMVANIPMPDPSMLDSRLPIAAERGWTLQRSLDTVNEVSHAFVVPAVLQVDGDGFDTRVLAWGARVAEVETELERVQSEVDELCFELYGISDGDRLAITEGFGVSDSDDDTDGSAGDDESDTEVELDPVGLAAGLVSWAVGVAAGRFDVRLATGEREWPVEPDPFDPLPVCSPGMLTGDDGLPLLSPSAGYPLVPSAVLVDDPGHELDLTARVRSVFDVVFGDQADAWWSDVGAVLDAKNGVEGWLRRGFFDHHLKTYSKSRRKAPIMWPIGTRSGSYRIWLYGHQVTNDTLFRILGDVVEPKLATEQRRLSDLTQEYGPSPSASQRRTLDGQQSLVDELIELRDELRAVAPLWHPNLNDGIVIVLAPLWRLFAHHRAWSKELKDRWSKLAKGDYDWAQLAMHIWPEHVIPKCAVDRSLAIAHDLEDTFWAQDDTNPDKWHPRQTPTTPIDQLIADRTNPPITTARDHPNP